MDNLTLITCSYNTPEVTITMLKSFFSYHNPTKVIVCDNSTNYDTAKVLTEHNVPYFSNPGGVHIKSVDLLFEKVTTKYALLVDTDVIFSKDNNYIFNMFSKEWKDKIGLLGEVCGNRGGKKIHNRVHPWYCLIDLEQIKSKNIKFYNPELHFAKSDKIYDVGCTFFSDVKENKIGIGNLNINIANDYYKHYEGMSWRTNRFGDTDGDIDFDSNATHTNQALYEYGLLVEKNYKQEVEKYKHQKINAL